MHNALPNRRRCIRLQGYDYAQAGAYFVTLCTHGRACILGDIADGQMRLSEAGQIILRCWDGLPQHYAHIFLDALSIMPNHVHGILLLDAPSGAGLKPAPTPHHGLPEVVRALKTFSAREINAWRATPGTPVWQRSYYERIIRNERELFAIQEYIENNPAQWALDRENPARG